MDAAEQGCGQIICLGDITGYGYDAKEALELVRRYCRVSLMGNHDSACARVEDENQVQQISSYDLDRAQRAEIGEEGLAWLAKRPLTWNTPDGMCAFSHGDFENPRVFDYVMSVQTASRQFKVRSEQVLFVGHTHHAEVYVRNQLERIELQKFRSFNIRPGWRYLVNVGSVGYPRNDFQINYAIYDDRIHKVIARTLNFDFKNYISNMLKHKVGFPSWLLNILYD